MECIGVISGIKEPTPWCSGMVVVPKGDGSVRILPNGVMKVVRTADDLSNSFCQKPELALIFEKTFALANNNANDCSTEGSKYLSLHTAWFNFVFGINSAPHRMSQILADLAGTICHTDIVMS